MPEESESTSTIQNLPPTTLEPPKEGTQTSSYKMVLWSLLLAALAPLPPLIVAFLSTKPWFPIYLGPFLQEYLTGLLVAFAGTVGVVGIHGVMKNAVKPYIEGRTEVSIVKANGQIASATGMMPPTGNNSPQITNSVRQDGQS